MADTLPNVNVLDKVYPGWRSLVADGTINKFMSVKLTGALTTELFGISHAAGSDVSVIPGLSQIMLGSPYPNFAIAMADVNSHRLQIGDKGWFGTMTPTIIKRGDTSRFNEYDSYNEDEVWANSYNAFGDIDFVGNTEKIKIGSWLQGLYSYESSWGKTYPEGTDRKEYTTSAECWKYETGGAIHSILYGRAASFLSKYGYVVDPKLPIFVGFGNLLHTSFLPQGVGAFQDLCLPGRKIIKLQVPATEINVGTIETFNNTVFIAVSVHDSGSPSVLHFYTSDNGTKSWVSLAHDNRYVPGTSRIIGQGIWSDPINLVAAYGTSVDVDGTKITCASVNDGLGTNGPMITDATGSWNKKSINFTPLLGIPGNMNYHFFGKVTESEKQVVVNDKQITYSTINVEVAEFVMKYNFSWYENYYKTGFDVYTPRSSNIQANTLKTWAAISQYDLAVYGSTVAYNITEQMVKQTNLYRAYKRAQDKACRDDKFLELKFDDQNTYAQMLQKAKSGTVFMNLVSPSLNQTISVAYESGTIKMESGSVNFYPSSGEVQKEITDERYMELVIQGVSRVAAAETALGLVGNEVEAQVKGNTLTLKADYSSYTGANPDNVWMDKAGAMINGYPVISAMNIDQRVVALGLNATQFQPMLSPTLRLIESLTAAKMWARFK